MPGLVFNIIGNASSLNRATSQASSAFGKLRGAAAAVGVGAFLADSVEGWQEHEQILRQTEAVIKSTGGAANVSAGQVDDLATAIERKTGVDGDAIIQGENLLLTFKDIKNEAGDGNDIFNQTTDIMVDMAAAMGTDAASQAVKLGKALNDPTRGVSALTKVGVTFTQQQRDQIAAMQAAGDMAGAQRIILAELRSEFGGSAAAQMSATDRMMVGYRELQDALGEALAPAFTAFVGILTDDVIPAFSATVGFVRDNWDWIGKLGAAVLVGVAAWKVYKGVMIASAAWAAAQAGMAGVQLALTGVSARANAAGLALNNVKSKIAGSGATMGLMGAGAIGAGLAIGGLIAWQQQENETAARIKQETQEYTDSLDENTGALTGNTRAVAAKHLQDSGAFDVAQKAGIGLGELTDAVLENGAAYDDVRGRIDAYTQSSGGMLSNGFKLSASLEDQRGELEASRRNFQQNKEAIDGASDATAKHTSAANDAKAAMDRESKAASDLKRAMQQLTGDAIDAQQAEIDFRNGVAGATEQVNQNGRSLSIQTAKGRENRSWLLDQIQSLGNVATAQVEAGASVASATGKWHANRDALAAAAIKAGLNRAEVNALLDTYAKIPPLKTTKVTASVYGAGAVYDLITSLREVRNSDASVSVYVNGDERFRTNAQGTGYFTGAGNISLVGENGPEIVRIPTGAQVLTSTHTSSLQRMNGGGPTIVNHITIQTGIGNPAEIGREVFRVLEHAAAAGVKGRIAKAIN